MTHSELVQRAVRWLLNSRKCQVVISEMASGAFEEPDAIGWRSGVSYLVECKASASDMRRDAHKPHRRNPDTGMGQWRYVMAGDKLAQWIADRDLAPEGWGVLSVGTSSVRVLVSPRPFRANKTGEVTLMSSAMQRSVAPKTKGVAVRVYTHHVENPRAEIHVSEVPA